VQGCKRNPRPESFLRSARQVNGRSLGGAWLQSSN